MPQHLDAGPIRIALVGAGAIARSHLDAVAADPRTRLVACADVEVARAERVGAAYGVPAFDDHQAMLADVACDAVVVCTPPVNHLEVAIDALRAGAHVLCEKPLAIGAFAARRMYAAAAEAGRILTMASKFRFVEDVVQTRALIEAGAIGRVLRVECTFMSRVDMSTRWNSRVEVSGGGVIMDNGTHAVDIARFLIGPLTAAAAVDTSTDPRYDGCDESASLFVRNAAGAVGAIALSWSCAARDDVYLRVHGSEGWIEVRWDGARSVRHDGAVQAFGRGYDKQRAFAAQLCNFVGAVRGEHPPAIGRDDAIGCVEVIDAAYDAIRRNQWSSVQVRRLTPYERLIGAGELVVGR